MPNDKRPAITVVTSGMSERPMANGQYAELMLILPPTWPTLDDPAMRTPEGFWPYRLLSDPPAPYSRETKLCGALIAPMLMPDAEGAEVFVHDGHEIELLSVWPLHADEMRVKLDEGLDRLFDLLDDAKIMEILEADRPSVVPKRSRRFFRR